MKKDNKKEYTLEWMWAQFLFHHNEYKKTNAAFVEEENFSLPLALSVICNELIELKAKFDAKNED
jgi:hypothetical protein